MAKKKILHLEDNRDDVELVRHQLVAHGVPADLQIATSKEEFFKALTEEPGFDLILSDSQIAGIDGLSALKEVRRRDGNTRFIFVSGSDDVSHAANCLAAGSDDFITKSQLWRLVPAVEKALKEGVSPTETNWTRKENFAMERLLEAVQALSMARTVEDIQKVVREAAREISGSDGATIVLRDNDQCHYVDENAVGPLWKGKKFPMTACISGWCMIHRRSLMIEDIYQDARVPVDAYKPTFVKSLAMVPIRAENPIGAIGNYWAQTHRPSAHEMRMLQALADSTSVAFENVNLYQSLEQKVKDRTAELEFTNKELESFSYSVSHDLRAPLRAVSSFAEILESEHGATLNEDAKGLLSRVISAAGRMRELIEGLLDLSRVSRTSIQKTDVNLATIAREIATRAAETSPNTKISIKEGLKAYGDSRLLRIIMENLMSNAIKFSGKLGTPKVEVGAAPEDKDGQAVFYVRDNGAGFDPQFAVNLFAPFQRLHSESEFEGTGVGLATVQRIIHRHGGRIWAESSPGKGATFYFSLPRALVNPSTKEKAASN